MIFNLRPLDFYVLLLYLLSITSLGLYFTKRQKTTRDYFLGGRELPWWAVMLSIVATETSAVTVISIPGVAFNPQGGNFTFLQIAFGYLIGRVFLSIIFIPKLYNGDYFTVYGYLKERFGELAKNVAVITFFISRVLATGLRIFLGGLVTQLVTGLDIWISIVVTGLLALIYTTFGGFIGVIWTDVVQFVIYLGSALIAMLVIINQVPGGLNEVIQIGIETNKFQIFNFTFNPTVSYAFWAGLIGGCFLTMATHGTDQSIGQRLLACRTESDSKKSIVGSGILVIIQFTFFLMLGVMLYAFYQYYEPKTAFTRLDTVYPIFAMQRLPQGIGGLVLAGIFAAAMSTVSSDINALSNTTVNDLYKRYVNSQREDRHYLKLGRIFTIIWGIIMILIGIAASGSQQSIIDLALTIPSYTFGALLGIFLLGFLTTNTNERGVILGALVGTIMVILVAPFWPITKIYSGPAIKLAWPWYSPIGCLTTMIIGYLSSIFLFSNRKN